MATITNYDTVKQESLELFHAYGQWAPDSREAKAIRNQIMELNLGLVRKEAYHWSQRCQENYEDLLQVGSLGLLQAIERFSVQKGNAFSSFAVPYVRGKIQHYLRDKSSSLRIPRRWLEIKRQASRYLITFREEHQRQPTDGEIAQALAITLEEWQDVKLAHQNRSPLSLDVPLGKDEDQTVSLSDVVPDHQYRSFQLAQEDQIRIQQALATLEEKTRKVLEFVFLHDLTQKETAEVLGVSVVTVSRHMKKGLNLLKRNFSGG